MMGAEVGALDSEMKYIYTVYQENSFSRAAEKLFISQSAISAMVRKAEKRLGCPIFDRSTIPFSLTEEGKFYIERVKKILTLENDIQSYFDDRKNMKAGCLKIGSSSFYSAYFLAPMINAFQKQFPGIHIDIKEGDGRELQNFILDGTIDLLFGALSQMGMDAKTQDVLFSYEHLILTVPEQYEVNNRLKPYRISAEMVRNHTFLDEKVPPVPLSEFRDCPFISLTKAGSDLFQRTLDICRNAGFKPNITYHLSQIMTAYFVCAAGGGAALIRSSLLSMLKEQPGLVYYKIGDPLAKRPIYLTYSRERYMSSAMSAFLKFVAALPAEYRI